MRVLLLLAAAVIAAPAVAATPAPPPQPAASPPQAAQDVRKEAPKLLPSNQRNDSRRIQVRPGKPNPESKAGPGIG